LRLAARRVYNFIGRQDIEDYVIEAYRRTAERIAAGELKDDGDPGAEQA
jgi:hypothetical protein